MINCTNLKELLKNELGFVKENNIERYCRHFDNVNCDIAVDFDNERITYPTDKGFRVSNEFTCNFSDNENFVVLECVCRLLEKGYRPEHMELERKWKLGHDAKGGRADICVSDLDGKETLFIIECKTPGPEFNKELKNTRADGGQLFSYWQQEPSAQWLVLYASDFADGRLSYKTRAIRCLDDRNILKQAERDKNLLTYERARQQAGVNGKFEAWKETYNCQLFDDVLFHPATQAYRIGVPPLLKKDLREFEEDNKVVNRFEEILRHNNVSDKENAFNRLIALFICKLVDEIKKQDIDEVEFQYKPGTDTYEDLQDRLQRLHKEGMQEFMKEDIFYVPQNYAEKLFLEYTGSSRRKAIESLNETIRCLKFYSNNEFAFKDVHNEELFYQNGKVVMEMVQLFQPYRIVYPSKLQLLGDLFEQLLAKGFKQNEGQFFTPTPITRFIWDSLPLQRYITEHGLPRVVDYACGAGHFLTEAVEAVNMLRKADLEDKGVNDWVRDHIVGIEKDYRLARVSKISLFMNGAGGGNIIFGDGLENYPDKDVRPASFDILVANPPYSVSAFKPHLKLKNNQFRLLEKISNDGSEIETLFVERIAQLLKPQGIAAVVLPSSLLSNGATSYVAAREELLRNFHLRAVACLGSQTFGATGTNTVTLFLQKYDEPPRRDSMVEDIVDGILSGPTNAWRDHDILLRYSAMQGIEADLYLRFLRKELSLDEVKSHPYLRIYAETLPAKRELCDYALPIEREKLYYYAITCDQRTLIVTAPSENAAQKAFLGYHWSNRKGDEGIKIDTPGGLLYNAADRKARGTLSCAIRNTFLDPPVTTTLDEQRRQYAKQYCLADLIDFSRAAFDKAIRTSQVKKIEIKSKYEIVPLGQFEPIQIKKGETITKAETIDGDYKVVAGGKDFAYKCNKYNRIENTITISASGANAGFVNFWTEKIFASDCTTIRTDSDVKTKYIYIYLKSIEDQIMATMQKGAAQPHVYPKDIEVLPIPNISPKLQERIVAEWSKVDEEYNTSRMTIEDYRKRILQIFENEKIMMGGGISKPLERLMIKVKGNNTKIAMEEIRTVGKYPVVTQERGELISGYTDSDAPITDLPLVVFGDHSCTFKYVDFDFVRGADGTQLIKVDESEILTKYLHGFLLSSVIENAEKYERHFKYLKRLHVPLPPLDRQHAIVAEVEHLETLIAQEQEKMQSCSARKQAILNKYL